MSNVSSNQNIIPFLWFDGKAEEAINLYTSVFPNSKIDMLKKWPAGSGFSTEWVMASTFTINGLQVHAFDAGPQFQFNESVSFFVLCKDQEEIDHYWNKLTEAGGKESQCGWLKDKFGFSWQIVPRLLSEKMTNGEPARLGKMMQALRPMKKLIIADLERAYNS